MSDISNFTMQENAHRHLWMHFTRMSESSPVPVIVRGEGVWVYDQYGKRYLDGLSGLFTSQVGHGRTELAEAAARQANTLAYFPIWSYAHPDGHRAGRPPGRADPGRLQPDLLHHRWLRGGGVGLEAGPPVLRRHRPAGAARR